MIVGVTLHAHPNERFAAGAFDSQVGRTIRVSNADGKPMTTGQLTRAVVAPDGRTVDLTLDVTVPKGSSPEVTLSTGYPQPERVTPRSDP